MTSNELFEILAVAGRLKTTTRHCYTARDRKESVAEHSWRVALWGMLLTGTPEFSDVDINKVVRMALIHDLGEAFTGDVPSFEKTDAETDKEKDLFFSWVDGFSEPQRSEWLGLLREMEALQTPEALLYKALDKMEAVLSHDESDIATWLPLEYQLQTEYGWENVRFSEFLTELRSKLDAITHEKIASAEKTTTDAEEKKGVAP